VGKLGKVGESWGKLGVCGVKSVRFVGGAAKSGGGVGQKNTPRSRGAMATLPAKAVQSYGVVCDGGVV
jgi:hypothetical protein